MAHYVYIIQSLKDNRFYIGETADVEARLLYHNQGKQRSTRFRTPFKIRLVLEFDDRHSALLKEKEIKSWKGGNKFKALIDGQ